MLIDSLFYADDAALISKTVETATKRLEAIQKGLKEKADVSMTMHMGKTKVMHAQQTLEIAKPKAQEYKEKEVLELMKEKCEGCGTPFVNVKGLHVHQRSCDRWQRLDKDKDYGVEAVVEARGTPGESLRYYYVRWQGKWDPEQKHSWIPEMWCNSDRLVDEYYSSNGIIMCRRGCDGGGSKSNDWQNTRVHFQV